jgi:predicted nucleotidyltransferase
VTAETERIVQELREALASAPPLRLALLFGSGAKGRLRPESDLDVGVVPVDPEMTLRDELALATLLGRATGREVDIVRLDRAPALLRWEVARNHRVLLADPPETRSRFIARAALEHAEMRPLLEDARRRLARRLRGGVT